MTNKERTHLLGIDDVASPKHLTKEEFGRRLYKMMIAKGWRQSELARRAGILRSNVSAYITGKAYPTAVSLKKLADALGVSPEELLPNHMAGAIAEDKPSFEMKISPGDPKKAWIKLDRAVSAETATKIAALVTQDVFNSANGE